MDTNNNNKEYLKLVQELIWREEKVKSKTVSMKVWIKRR